MLKTKDIRELLVTELKLGHIKDSGYELINGRKYIDLRNILFECDSDYIFQEIPAYPWLKNWYNENYEPIVRDQITKCAKKLCNNSNSRQAVIFMADKSELDKEGMICTMYIHVFLDKCEYGYNMEYIVHMRSSDSIEFRSDLAWNKTVISRLIMALEKAKGYKIHNVKIIWCADSFQLYDKQFEKIGLK